MENWKVTFEGEIVAQRLTQTLAENIARGFAAEPGPIDVKVFEGDTLRYTLDETGELVPVQ